MYKIGREYFVTNFILYYISHASAAIVVQVCSKVFDTILLRQKPEKRVYVNHVEQTHVP